AASSAWPRSVAAIHAFLFERRRGCPARRPGMTLRKCFSMTGTCSSRGRSLLRLIEISQIRRRLVFLCRHQEAVETEHVILPANADVVVAFTANVFDPDRSRIGISAVSLFHRPGTCQGVVDRGDLVVKKIPIVRVEID